MATKTEILAKLADQHEQRIVNVLYDLEDDIINSLQAASGGQKLTTQLAIQLRPNLKRLIEENYLKEGDLLIRDYDKVINNYQSFIKNVPIADRFKTLTKPDLAVINQLKQLSFSGFEDVANRFLTTISDEVYKSAIVGKPFPDMVKAIRGEINGVYQRSNENAINRLVDIVDKNKFSDSAISKKLTADATRILHTKYASDRVGRNMRMYASQQAHDSIMQFDAQFTKYKAEEAGITSFKYTGTNIITTRDFCRARVGNVYTEEEARSIWAANWKGKSGSDPFIDRGGYRCRHSFIPYDPAWDLEDDVEGATKQKNKDIYGELGELERELIEESFGKTKTPYSTAISLISPIKNIFRTKGKSPYYYPADDFIEMGESASKAAIQNTIIHEYTHRLDFKLNDFLLKNPNKRKKVLEGFETPHTYLIGKSKEDILSSYNVRNLIDDDKLLSGTLSKRKKTYNTKLDEINDNAPSDLVNGKYNPKEFDKYYAKINNEYKSKILKNEEIVQYLDYNEMDSSPRSVLTFKLKIDNKYINNSSVYEKGVFFDNQFSSRFNDYIGSITKESLGAGHGQGYYDKFSLLQTSGIKKFTKGNTLEAWAEHSSITQNPLKEIANIETKLAEHYAPNTTKGFDTLIKRIGELNE
jgi:hypothetical protein